MRNCHMTDFNPCTNGPSVCSNIPSLSAFSVDDHQVPFPTMAVVETLGDPVEVRRGTVIFALFRYLLKPTIAQQNLLIRRK